MPRLFRIAAGAAMLLTLLAIGIGFYRARSNPEFRMKGFPTALSKDVVAEVNGYERREADGDVARYYIKADRATTFSDNHQELQNVYLEVFDSGGSGSDRITAAKAVYIPEENKNFTGYFAGDVNITTRDALKVRTEQVTYRKADEIASAEEQVLFERNNLRGSSFGALINVPAKRLELLKDVNIETVGPAGNAKHSTIKAGYAAYDQGSEEIELRDSVLANVTTTSGNADVRSGRAHVYLTKQTGETRDINKIEIFENVEITARQGDGKTTNIKSQYALYNKPADRFDVRDGVRITTAEDERPTILTANSAVYEQGSGHITVEGSAEVIQGNNLIKGDRINAELYGNKKLRSSLVRGNAFLRQAAADRTVEVTGTELNSAFNENQQLTSAKVVGNATAILAPVNATDYSKVTLTAPTAIRVAFKGEGAVDQMLTEGRTTIQLDAPDKSADAADKRVTADSVSTFFDNEGKNIRKAEAVGNAELFVEPLQARAENYKTTVNAPRFDCEFFPTGNSAKVCIAATKTKTVRVPTVSAADRGTQTLTADKLTASFDQRSHDVERLDAAGAAKFSELERNAVAEQITFTQADQFVRLRGGEPTVWDTRARARAGEIDWDTRNQRSALRGSVSTTYYSQKQTGGATPFAQTDKPVYITAASGDFDHRADTASYSGNARGWQENNYVRAEKLIIQQKEGQFIADGSVQSLLYNAKRTENGREANVPVFATSKRMTYNRDSRLLHYEDDVDIRQGNDRIVGGAANVYIDGKGDVARTDIEKNVVITQPNRRAAGDFAQYVAADQSVVLRGNPARVYDAESGSSEGGQLTVYLNNNRILGEGKTKQNSTGRTRSVYKVKNN
jgi:LPS export ABC transporter protein LptC